MEEKIKVYVDSNEKDFITDCYFADNTKVSCEFYHEESEIEYSNCKLLNLQDYIKEKDQQIVYLQSQLDQQKSMWQKLKEWLEKAILRNKDNIISKNDYENVLVIMQELEGEDENTRK